VIGWNWDCGLPVKFKTEMYGEREIESVVAQERAR
jgi:hypothetical protein